MHEKEFCQVSNTGPQGCVPHHPHCIIELLFIVLSLIFSCLVTGHGRKKEEKIERLVCQTRSNSLSLLPSLSFFLPLSRSLSLPPLRFGHISGSWTPARKGNPREVKNVSCAARASGRARGGKKENKHAGSMPGGGGRFAALLTWTEERHQRSNVRKHGESREGAPRYGV